MNYIRIILLGLSISTVWGLFFLDANQEEKTIGYIFALLFSFYGSYFLKEGRDNKRWNIFEVFSLMLFPLLYLLAFFVTQNSWSIYSLFNPMLSGLVVLLLGLQLTDLRKQKALQFFTLAYIFVHSFSLILYHNQTSRISGETYDFSTDMDESQISQPVIDLRVNVDQLSLQKSDGTIMPLANKNRPIILETWHEKCPPCLNAINDMQDFFKEQKEHLDHYYVYNPPVFANGTP